LVPVHVLEGEEINKEFFWNIFCVLPHCFEKVKVGASCEQKQQHLVLLAAADLEGSSIVKRGKMG